MDSRYQCDDCGQSWGKVHAGPMLEDEVWHRIAELPQDILCNGCVRARINQTLGRPLQFSDLLVCPFNAFTGYLDELVPPGLLDMR